MHKECKDKATRCPLKVTHLRHLLIIQEVIRDPKEEHPRFKPISLLFQLGSKCCTQSNYLKCNVNANAI